MLGIAELVTVSALLFTFLCVFTVMIQRQITKICLVLSVFVSSKFCVVMKYLVLCGYIYLLEWIYFSKLLQIIVAIFLF